MRVFPSIAAILLLPSVHAELARWSDPALPVKDGVELWLDGSRENEAREAHYMNRLSDGARAEVWHDSSGLDRHLVQWSDEARPTWNTCAFGFDGNDFLASLLTPGFTLKEATIFVVASVPSPAGNFPALLSTARRDENDFTSGICVDFGRELSPRNVINYLNVEGAGQLKERNTLVTPVSSANGHVFSIAIDRGQTTVRLDGKDQGRREKGDVAFAIDRFAVGARFVAPEMRHFLKGRIAEIVVFGRRLTGEEIAGVESYLKKKHEKFLVQPSLGAAPDPVVDPPIVQMLVPGFEVHELPIQTSNLNNIEYAPDGRLFAGAYDGRFHLMRDRDGDGLEEELFTFETRASDDYPLGMIVKDGMPHAVLSDEIVRFRDTDRDGIPDKRETVVKGWDDPKLRNNPLLMHRRVDSAMALAAGPDDDWYVTMGSANPGNGYWQQKDGDPFATNARTTGKPLYSPDKLRGCLLRIYRNGKVEHLNSGLRYIMSLQWDRHGELFGTDQEGATWLPNGNPFDELLHLQKGRHYGFPPRHPDLLPNVVDEPSVWDYTPQHQSTCGFRFNGPAQGRARFGPEFWAHDAIVTGEGRGKLWRTSLAKTPAGYVANNQLFACVGMLVVDCAISPNGELVICCHSGPPDWGKGPAHPGRLFKIRYVGSEPQSPVGAWAKSPTETVVEFDRPLPEQDWSELKSRITMVGGPFVAAGDRFETLRPGYAVVRMQQDSPSFDVPVNDVRVSDDRHSLIITSGERRSDVAYAVTLPAERKEGGIKQVDAVDLAYDLTGLQAKWEGSGVRWEGRLPHPDFSVVKELTRGSASNEAALRHFSTPGKLTLSTRLDLANMLRPRTQPGSKLDYEPAPEEVTVSLRCDSPVSLKGPGISSQGKPVKFSKKVNPAAAWQDLDIEIPTPVSRLEMTFHTSIDATERPLSVTRFHMPFADARTEVAHKALLPQLAGGDRERGKALYFGKASCFTCHQFEGQGHAVGPDLSNSMHRDYESVMRDITDPNASINPDAVAYMVTRQDGSVVAGTRIGETAEELRLAAPGGVVTAVKKSDIKKSEVMSTSLMPPGLLSALTPGEVKDLMTFLMSPLDKGK